MDSSPRSAWPVLASIDQQKSIQAILTELEGAFDSPFRDDCPNLTDGSAGRALFFGYLSKLPGKKKWAALALETLEQAVSRVEEFREPDLFSGYTGLAWAVEHLQRQVLGPQDDAQDGNTSVDEVLLEILSRSAWKSDYDLISGLVGFGVYALERHDRPSAREILAKILSHLEQLAVPRRAGVSWLTHPDLLPGWQLQEAPNGYYNFGLAHGVPGVLLLLSAMTRAGIAPGRSGKLLEGGMEWLFSQFQNPACGSYLPDWCRAEREMEEEERSRVAWCYGDLGTSLALWECGRLTDRPAWREKALEMGRLAASRSLKDSEIMDTCLCHGSAGNLVMFMRHYYNSGESCFLEASQAYLQHLIDTRTPGRPFAGYTHHCLLEEFAPDYKRSWPGLLEGALGAGLGLMTALGIAPDWDRFLMLSTPLA